MKMKCVGVGGGEGGGNPVGISLVPRPHPLRGKRGLVNLDTILGPGKGI